MMRGYRLFGSFDLALCYPTGIIWTFSLGGKVFTTEEICHMDAIRLTNAQTAIIKAVIDRRTGKIGEEEYDEVFERYDVPVEAGWRSHYLYDLFKEKDISHFFEGEHKENIEQVSKEIEEVSRAIERGYKYRSITSTWGRRKRGNIFQPIVALAILTTCNPVDALNKLKEIDPQSFVNLWKLAYTKMEIASELPIQEEEDLAKLFLGIISFLETSGFGEIVYPEVHIAIKNSYSILLSLPKIPLDLKRHIVSAVLSMLLPHFYVYIISDLYLKHEYIYIMNYCTDDDYIIGENKCKLAQLYSGFLEEIKKIYKQDVITFKWINDVIKDSYSKLWVFLNEVRDLALRSDGNEKCHKCNALFSELKNIKMSSESKSEIEKNIEKACEGYNEWLRELSQQNAKKIYLLRESLRKLIKSPIEKQRDFRYSIEVKMPKAIDPITSGKILLSKLAKDRDWRIREAVAKNPRTKEVLYELAKDDYWPVRAGVTHNPNITEKTLSELAKDPHKEVRIGVANNPKTSKEILSELAADYEWEVRKRVAENITASPNILSELLEDEDWRVRRAASENPNAPSNDYKLDEDTGYIFSQYVSSLEGYEEKVEKALSKYKEITEERPEDWKIHSAFLDFVLKEGLFKEAIKLALNNTEQWMRKHGTYRLFRGYIKLVRKAPKIYEVNTESVREFGYQFYHSCKWRDKDAEVIAEFANWIWESNPDEAKQIYDELFRRIKANNYTMSGRWYEYSRRLLREALNTEITNERIEKLERVEKGFSKALEYNKENYMAHAMLAITLKEKGDKERYVNEMEVAKEWRSKLGGPDGEIPYKIGELYLECNRDEKALYWFEIATDEESENFVNWWKLGYTKVKIARKLEEKGLVKESELKYSSALINLGKSWEEAKEYERRTGRLIQLPAREEIPTLIDECMKKLDFLKKKGRRDGG